VVQGDDDPTEAVAVRLDVLEEQTRTLIEQYRRAGRLVEIDALKSVGEGTAQLEAARPSGGRSAA